MTDDFDDKPDTCEWSPDGMPCTRPAEVENGGYWLCAGCVPLVEEARQVLEEQIAEVALDLGRRETFH